MAKEKFTKSNSSSNANTQNKKVDNTKKIEEVLAILGIRSNNILNVELVSGFVNALGQQRDSKEYLKSSLNLCNLYGSPEGKLHKAAAIDSSKKIADFTMRSLSQNYSPNDDRMKTRALKTIKTAVDNITENAEIKVAIVVCPTKKQEDLSFAAANSYGIVQSLLDKRGKAMIRGDLEGDAEATTILTNLLTEIDKASGTLTSMIDEAFAKGHGTYEQISSYGRRTVDANKKEITDDVKAGLSAIEISEKYKILPRTLTFSFNKAIKGPLLNSLKEEILKKKEDNVSYKNILKEVNIDESIINTSSLGLQIKEWLKNESPSKKDSKVEPQKKNVIEVKKEVATKDVASVVDEKPKKLVIDTQKKEKEAV